jgi:hypothetical protein
VYQLEVKRQESSLWGESVDISLTSTDEKPWYEGDDGSADQVQPSFHFGSVEAISASYSRDGKRFSVRDYRGDGFLVEVDRSDEVGEIGVHVDISQESGASFKIRYFPGP